MSALNLGPTEHRNPLPAVLIALGVLSAAAVAVFYFNPHRTGVLKAEGTQTYIAHTETTASAGSVHVIGTVGSADDDLYVAVTLSLTDSLRLPLFIKDETAVLTLSDGSIQEASAVAAADIPNLLITFPQLKPLVGTLLARDTQVAPGETATGTVLLHFAHATENSWRNRKSADVTLSFFHQSPMNVTVP